MARNRLPRTWLAFCLIAAPAAHAADVFRGSDLLGHAVVTPDGQDVGTVRDLAIDTRTGALAYVVVSVGSFLIENNLIAVAPNALVATGSPDGVLRLETDAETLRRAQRFATDGPWPARADVQRSVATAAVAPAAASASAAPEADETPTSGTATITSATKSARLTANERTITAAPSTSPVSTAAKAPALPPIEVSGSGTPFERLDKDHDGVLNRSEFAHEMSRTDSYTKIDANANGVIEPREYEAFAATKP
jgi:sporulation protein YlmC with PRC-barrel domain